MSEATIEGRVYAIRLALGDGFRVAMPMSDFATLLMEKGASTRYDSSVISRIENGERKLTLDDVAVIAAVDPKRRGKLWLGWGETVDAEKDTPVAQFRIPDSMAETFSRARRAATPAPPDEEPAPEPRKRKAAGDRPAPKPPKDQR